MKYKRGTNLIHVTVSGLTGAGKTPILREIKKVLTSMDLRIIIPNESTRSEIIHQSVDSSLPLIKDNTVIILQEENLQPEPKSKPSKRLLPLPR